MLWDDGRLTGIIDWTNACLGPGEVDLAHCRINLVCLYGREVADQFGAACERSGTVPRHPYWDLRCAADFLPLTEVYPGWVELGRRNLSLDEIRSRVDDWVRTLVAEF